MIRVNKEKTQFEFKSAEKASLILNIAFLAVHILYVILFALYGYTNLSGFNIISVGIYLYTLTLIKRKLFYRFTMVVYFEAVIYVTISIILGGYNLGS